LGNTTKDIESRTKTFLYHQHHQKARDEKQTRATLGGWVTAALYKAFLTALNGADGHRFLGTAINFCCHVTVIVSAVMKSRRKGSLMASR
jgi:hypothetical protein